MALIMRICDWPLEPQPTVKRIRPASVNLRDKGFNQRDIFFLFFSQSSLAASEKLCQLPVGATRRASIEARFFFSGSAAKALGDPGSSPAIN